MPHVETFLRDLAIVLVVAAFTTVICQRLRLPVVVGYILAGIITGPGTPPALVTDTTWIRTLGELGVVLLMFVIGLEFSLRRLARLLPITGPAAVVETSLMLALGFMTARLAGWDGRASFFAAGVVAISSTMIVAKAFDEKRPPRRLEDLVFGILLVEDMVAILLLVALTALGSGEALSGFTAIKELLKLVGFLAILLAGGMLIVPRAMRSIVALKREETTLVSAVGVAFLFALMAQASGYSVALGAFLAGALVRESGVAHHIIDLVRPLRDMFAAIFFVTVGMLVEPRALMEAPGLVVAFTLLVLTGKLVGVTLGGFLSGFGLRTAVQAGMTLAQIGEFSFVIAGVGLTTNAAPAVLYQVAVAVSVITALFTPLLMRLADPLSAVIDRHLPKPVQTVVTLYESWVELLRRRTKTEGTWVQIRRPLRWMLIDAVVLLAIALIISLARAPLGQWLISVGLPERFGLAGLFVTGLLISGPVRLRAGGVGATGRVPVCRSGDAHVTARGRCGARAAWRAGGGDPFRHGAGAGPAAPRHLPAVPERLARGRGDRRLHLPAHVLVLALRARPAGSRARGRRADRGRDLAPGRGQGRARDRDGAGDAAGHGHDRAVQGRDGEQGDRPLAGRPESPGTDRRQRRGDQPERPASGVSEGGRSAAGRRCAGAHRIARCGHCRP